MRNPVLALLSAAAVSALLSAPAWAQADRTQPETGSLTVRIDNVSGGGVIRLGLYTQAIYPDDNADAVASADVNAVAGETVVTLHKVPVGTYAIQVFQDLNSNGKMDTGFLGIPKEPYGFSRDAKPVLSKPDFDRVKFDIAPGANAQVLHLQNTTTMVAVN